MGVTSTHDLTGRQIPLVTAPAGELGEDTFHRATPAQTYDGSQEKLEKYGNAGRCSRLWESEMRMQKIGTGV